MPLHSSPSVDSASSTSVPPVGQVPPVSPAADRMADGRFAKNNPGGPGNPFNRQVAALRRALLYAVTAADLEEIVAVLLIKAKGGDLAAIKLLLSYTIGKPGPAADPDTLDQQEWQIHQQAAVPPKEVDELLTAMPAATANLVAQVGWPCAARQQLQPVVAGLQAAEVAATTAPALPASTCATTKAPSDHSAAAPLSEPQMPPSANRVIGGHGHAGSADRASATASRSAIPRPPGLPDHIDWEYEQRIMGILFEKEESSPDTKRS